jgi:O-antigen ligase
MTRRIQLLSKLLLAFFVTCTFAILAAWAILLTTICSNPRTPMPEMQHVIPYNCHGMTVFISHLENAMLHWLIPIECLFVFLSLVAAVMVVLAHAKVRIDVQIHHTDASSKSPRREVGRD